MSELHAQLEANLPVLTSGCSRGEAKMVSQPITAWKGGGPGGSAAFFRDELHPELGGPSPAGASGQAPARGPVH